MYLFNKYLFTVLHNTVHMKQVSGHGIKKGPVKGSEEHNSSTDSKTQGRMCDDIGQEVELGDDLNIYLISCLACVEAPYLFQLKSRIFRLVLRGNCEEHQTT